MLAIAKRYSVVFLLSVGFMPAAGGTGRATDSPGGSPSPQPAAAPPVIEDDEAGGGASAACSCDSVTSQRKRCACGAGNATCCVGSAVDWSRIPPAARPMPRPGNFWIWPSGENYYSLDDHWRGKRREKPPVYGYPRFAFMPPSFFDADWRYVDAIDPSKRTLVEKMKRIHVGDHLLFATGGDVWIRPYFERNSRLTKQDNDYQQVRLRLFGDLWFEDRVRLYGEFLWSDTYSEDLRPLPVDANRGDILNLFVDLKTLEIEERPVYVRVGRQELLLGSQRQLSTLEWSNTRRTFEGVRVFRKGEAWDVDAFLTQLVTPDASDFDERDDDQVFGGVWVTNRVAAGQTWDVNYLFLDNDNSRTQQGIRREPSTTHTVSTRYAGDHNNFLWDIEGALQLGRNDGADVLAGTVTVGGGYHFGDLPLKPTGWLFYDWASGDSSPGSGTSHTYNQLFPFGHFFLGWADLVGRQNIHDLNAHLFFYPTPWITGWLQYHHFWLANGADALYNPAGVAVRRDPTGAAGNNVGDEVDLILNFHLSSNSNIMMSYALFWGGNFLKDTPGASNSRVFWLMYQLRF